MAKVAIGLWLTSFVLAYTLANVYPSTRCFTFEDGSKWCGVGVAIGVED
jgi:hypothetical protein